MKIIFFIACLAVSYSTIAQNKDNVFAGIGCNNFGLSVTYDRKLAKHLDLGAGAHYYDYNSTYYNLQTALFLDIREHWGHRRSMPFVYEDIGTEATAGREPADWT